jgi:hypothetical protein
MPYKYNAQTKTLTLVSSYSKGLFRCQASPRRGEETRRSNERFTLTPEPPSVNPSALPPPVVRMHQNKTALPFPLSHRFRNRYSVFSFFWMTFMPGTLVGTLTTPQSQLHERIEVATASDVHSSGFQLFFAVFFQESNSFP